MAGEGDPGRFTEELRKEHKNRRAGVLLSLAQVEYYHLPPGLRKTLYTQTPEEWAEWECSAGMAVPLPAVVTYRESRLIKGDSLNWRIFYTEWVLNTIVRFITDAHHRGLLWRTPQGHRQHLHFGSSFPPGGHSLLRGEGDPIIGACKI
jgi:hypothetical protein